MPTTEEYMNMAAADLIGRCCVCSNLIWNDEPYRSDGRGSFMHVACESKYNFKMENKYLGVCVGCLEDVFEDDLSTLDEAYLPTLFHESCKERD